MVIRLLLLLNEASVFYSRVSSWLGQKSWHGFNPVQTVPELLLSLDWNISHTCCLSAWIHDVKAKPRLTKVKDSFQSGKAPSWESRWVSSSDLLVDNCCCAGFERRTSRTLLWFTATIYVGAQATDWAPIGREPDLLCHCSKACAVVQVISDWKLGESSLHIAGLHLSPPGGCRSVCSSWT